MEKNKPSDDKTNNPENPFSIAQNTPESPIPVEVSNKVDEIVRRLRLLEERYSGLRKKGQFMEQNMLKDTKDLLSEITLLNENIRDMKTDMSDLKDKMVKISEEINSSVKKSEFNVLAKYVEFWQPLSFLTRDEAEKMIKEHSRQR